MLATPFSRSLQTVALIVALALFALSPTAQAGGGINVDFGTKWGEPAGGYAAASGQFGVWNQAGLGVTGLVDVFGSPVGVSVNVVAASDGGFTGSGPIGGTPLLLDDNFFSLTGNSWSANVSGLADGLYLVYVYAPSSTSVPTGTMNVGGNALASLSGDGGSTLIQGTSWAKVLVSISGGTLNISGSGAGVSGLAGLQIVPLEPKSLNVDFGKVFGVPASGYGAASGQVGIWNEADVGVTNLVDLAGSPSGVSVYVQAFSGAIIGSAINDDELLQQDYFITLGGGSWSASVWGLADGAYLVFVYAPSNSVVPTGIMNVGGTVVAELPGDAGSALIEGTSWARVPVIVSGGTLLISGASVSPAGLAGLQIVPVSPSTNYCTPGTSASGCNALISSTGLASASSASGFTLNTTGVEGSKDGLYFFGTNGRQANNWGASTSFQCVVPPVKRAGLLSSVGTPGQCNGSFSQDLNALWNTQPAKNPGAGATVQAQLWYRDPFSTSAQTTSLSDAIEFTVGT